MPRYLVLLAFALGIGMQMQAFAVGVREAPTAAPQAVPAKGMPMTQVERQYGVPAERRTPVGEPPIARWVYDGYTVYFEHQYVIHTVIHDR